MPTECQETFKTFYQILYVDGDPRRAAQIQMFFNDWGSDKSPQFFFVSAPTYKFALHVLAVCHLDALAQSKGFSPFDFVLFDLNIKDSKNRFSWINFVEVIFKLGLVRLKFPFGISSLVALGNPDEKAKEILLNLQIKLIQRPISVEQLRQNLLAQLERIPKALNFFYESQQINQNLFKDSYRVLYIDSNPIRATKIQLFFNDTNFQKTPRFLFVPAATYQLALQILTISQLEEVTQNQQWKPFDFILFTLNFNNEEHNSTWLNFIDSLFGLGLSRLNFSFGVASLIAVGNPCEATKDSLLSFQITLIKSPFSNNELSDKLLNQIKKFEESSLFYIATRTVEDTDRRRLVKRVLRFSRSMPAILLAYEESIIRDDGTSDINPVFKRSADFFANLLKSAPAFSQVKMPD